MPVHHRPSAAREIQRGACCAIGPGGTNKSDKGQLDTAAVTFKGNEWFKGGASDTATVDLMSPTSNMGGDHAPAYEKGTRLLVSGEPRWGGPPLEDAIAWPCGGFTSYYERAVAVSGARQLHDRG
ncbi:MAG: hypothetical protein NVS3B26_22610 [Mycobacteriales bacterium]